MLETEQMINQINSCLRVSLTTANERLSDYIEYQKSLREKVKFFYKFVTLYITIPILALLLLSLSSCRAPEHPFPLNSHGQVSDSINSSFSTKISVLLNSLEKLDTVLGIIFVLLFFSIILSMRHEKKVMLEIRYYSMMKYQIELYSGILDAAKFLPYQNKEEYETYLKENFNSIRDKLLDSPPYNVNNPPPEIVDSDTGAFEALKLFLTKNSQNSQNNQT